VGKGAKIEDVAQRVMQGKTMNAGQICLAPDYALVPEEKVDEFVKASVEATSEMYPKIKDNDDFTSIVNQRHYDRIQGRLEDAKAKGANAIVCFRFQTSTITQGASEILAYGTGVKI
jgi:coniferyl-aldehyde dehydrogenase